MTTSVPLPTFGPNGFIAPSEADIKTGVFADIDAAFGGGLNPDDTTPQGQLTVSRTALIAAYNDLFLKYTNLVDPAYSEGRMQDAIARINFLTRDPATPTTVTATCTGLPGTKIPVASLAKTANGDIFASLITVVIPLGGSVDVPFAAATTGPLACPIAFLDTIYQSIPGWDTITNAAAGTPGRDVESRAAFEQRRYASVAVNSIGTLGAVQGAVLSVPGVLGCYVDHNTTASPVSRNGVTLAPHSLYVCVNGGDTTAVAQAIFSKANVNDFTGTTTISVVDPNVLYIIPKPTYAISFTVAASLPLVMLVTLANNIGVPSNAIALVQAAIATVFNGTDGGIPPQIGSRLYANRFYAAIGALGAWAQIVAINIGSANDADAAYFTGSIATNVLTVTAVASGTLSAGQTISGGALGNTIITGQTGGTTGGAGTYTVSRPQTLASGPLVAYAPNASYVDVHADQTPTISAADIAVSLI